jgi:uncharacterized membrane protein YfcA
VATEVIIVLCVIAFAAGFIDAVVGGGGLIQTPAALVLLPQFPVATVIGSLKIPSFTGTSLAALQYMRKVRMDWMMLSVMTVIAFVAAYSGSKLLSIVHNDFMKPLLLVILVFVAVYTYNKKNFGIHTEKEHSKKEKLIYSVLISLVIGFYDGFIGPGAGSFLVLAFITLMGFDFLKASANAKMVNLATNLGSILFFVSSGRVLYTIAIPMAVSNAVGGAIGARVAISKGNRFIRIFFLLVVTGTLVRFAYDVFFK